MNIIKSSDIVFKQLEEKASSFSNYFYCCCLRGGIAEGVKYTATITYLLYFPSEFQSFLIQQPELSGSNIQTHLLAKQEQLGEK
jgi:hypothetical protein